jgi:hypothetical protein
MAALWAVAPGSIVLSMLYSEALFCALAIWSLIALVERRWLTAERRPSLGNQPTMRTGLALDLIPKLRLQHSQHRAGLQRRVRCRGQPRSWQGNCAERPNTPLGFAAHGRPITQSSRVQIRPCYHQGQRPFPNKERVSCMWFVNGALVCTAFASVPLDRSRPVLACLVCDLGASQ